MAVLASNILLDFSRLGERRESQFQRPEVVERLNCSHALIAFASADAEKVQQPEFVNGHQKLLRLRKNEFGTTSSSLSTGGGGSPSCFKRKK